MRQAWEGDQAGVDQLPIMVPMANGEALPVPNAAGTGSVPALSVSSGDIAYIPIPTLATYNVALNAALGTTRFFIADTYYRVAGIRFSYKTAGTSASIAIQVTKDIQGQAPGAGVSLLATPFDGVNATINISNTGTLVNNQSSLLLNPGDFLSVQFTGTLTTIAGVVVEVSLVNTCNTGLQAPAVVVNNLPLQTPYGKTQVSNVAMFYTHRNTDLATTTFFIANRDMSITAIYAVTGTVFATGVTVDVTKDTGTNAPGAGNSVLSAAMTGLAGTSTANTLVIPGLNLTTNRLNMAAGDRLAVKFSATTTGADIALLVVFAPLYNRIEQSFFLNLNAQQQVAQDFMIAGRNYEVIDASCVYGTTAGGAAKLAVTIDKLSNAPGAGNVVQTDNTNAGFDMNSTANTVQFMTPAAIRLRQVSPGDRIGLNPTGAAQNIAKVCVTVSLRPWS
jgi:hypothetical protein